MGKISVLKTATLDPALQEPDLGHAGCPPVSLLAFLEAENLRLRARVAELRRDTIALRLELLHN
jgi:hypothetical protein